MLTSLGSLDVLNISHDVACVSLNTQLESLLPAELMDFSHIRLGFSCPGERVTQSSCITASDVMT